jgi:RNA polymerase sigma factor (sigma-70 family)
MSAAISSANITLPLAALDPSRRVLGEASRKQENREDGSRYQVSRYTSAVPPLGFTTMTAGNRATEAYDRLYETMRFIAARKFNIPHEDVQPLIHDVFIAFLRHEAEIGDDRQWLVTAVCNASRNYLRDRRPTEPLPETLTDPRRLADDIAARLDLAKLLAHLPIRCRRVLWLRYVDGLDPLQIAAHCASSESAGYGRHPLQDDAMGRGLRDVGAVHRSTSAVRSDCRSH